MPLISASPRRVLKACVPGVAWLLLVAGCSPLDAGVQSIPLVLDAERPDRSQVGALEYRGGLVLGAPQSDFGGLSAVEIDPDGRRLVALSDRGFIVTARLDYDSSGRLDAAGDIELHPVPDAEGGPSAGRRADAEGLARLPDGRWIVSFERRHRLQAHADKGGIPGKAGSGLTQPPGLGEAPYNGGIEALAALPDGRLFAIEEGADENAGRHRAWLHGPEGWASLEYRGRSPYRPTGATTLPDGDVLVLERRASMLGGFGARLVRVDASGLKAGASVSGEELARIEPPLSVDNFEGIAALPAPGGGTNLYLVSDDNFWALQRTLLMMFHLPD